MIRRTQADQSQLAISRLIHMCTSKKCFSRDFLHVPYPGDPACAAQAQLSVLERLERDRSLTTFTVASPPSL